MTPALIVVLFAAAALAAEPDRIAPGITLLPGAFVEGRQPDGNTIVIEASEGLIVVDTGRHEEHTRAILDYAVETGHPIRAVINTHWHLDHISGNALVRDAHRGVRVWASEAFFGATKGFLANYRKQLEDVIARTEDPEAKARFEAERARIDSAPRLAPDAIVRESSRHVIAGRPLELRLAHRAATEADVWVLDPATRVLIAGDLVTLPVPFLDTACPPGWRSALEDLAAADFEILVPGHGAPMSRHDFETYRTAFGALLDCAASDRDRDACAGGWIASLGDLLPESEHAFTRRLLDYYVGQVLRGEDVPRNCT